MQPIHKSSIEPLKKLVEESLGHKILSAGDCQRLCDDIYKHTSHKLNLNTLRRCFGLVKTAYQPSVSTLNILSEYCGFTCYSQFMQKPALQAPQKENGDAEKGLLQYLVSLFANTDVQHKNDPTYLNFVKQTILFLNHQPQLVCPFQKLIAKTENGQRFYFEQFINIDRLASYYGEGLKHYLAEKKTPKAQLFGNGLLCFRSWLMQDREGVVYHYKKMLQFPFDYNTHPYVCGQYFAANLFYTITTGGAIEKEMAEARHTYTHLKPSKENYRFFPAYEMVLADALIMLGQYEEALFYIEAALKKKEAQLPAYMDKQLYHVFQLFYALALACTGKKDKAKEAIRMVDPNAFYFLRKKYYTIYYLKLKQFLGQQGQKTAAQLGHLIEATGFQFFKDYSLTHEYA